MAEMLLSQVANGLVLGFLYVLLAIGLSIICGLLGIVNFAHGALFALGAYFAIALSTQFGWAAVVLAPVLVAAVGVLIEVVFIRRLYGKEPLLSLIVTFALSLLLTALVRLVWGAGGLPFSPPEMLNGFLVYGPLLITKYRLFVLAATVAILVVLWWFMNYTPYGRILRAGSHLLGLISDILDLSKIEADKLEIMVQSFAAAPLVHEVADAVRPLMQRAGNTFVVEVADALGDMRSDPVRVRQVLFNVLSNAAKFTQAGTVTLRARRDGDRLVFAGEDTGIGMTAEATQRVFEAFHQADSSAARLSSA